MIISILRKLLLTSFSLLSVITINAQLLTPDQMKEDLSFFRKALEAKHPEMYRYTSREDFDILFRKTEESFTTPLTTRDFYTRMAPLIVALKCGHTKWLIPGKDMYYPFTDTNLFPLSVYFSNDSAFVTGSYTGENIPAKGKLLSINGESLVKIKDSLFNCLSFADGASEGGKYYQLNNFFPGIYSTYFGSSSEYRVEIIENEEHLNFSLRAADLAQIKKFYEDRKPADKDPFDFKVLDDDIALIDIDRFFTFPGEENYKKFLNKSFAEINKKNIKNLIIDLRGNEGGNEKWGILLYKYLALSDFRYYDRITVRKKEESEIDFRLPLVFRLATIMNRKGDEADEFVLGKGLRTEKPLHGSFKGRAYLLLDGQSFSVATEFASRAKSDGRCTIIGTETAGGYALNSSGFFTIVNLPNSKIDLGIPLMGFHMADLSDKNPKDRGIIPDYPFVLTPEMVYSDNDFLLDHALEIVRSSDKMQE